MGSVFQWRQSSCVFIWMKHSPYLSGHLHSSEFKCLSSSNNTYRLSVLLAWQVPSKTTHYWWICVIRISSELCGDLSLLFTLYFSSAAFKMKDWNYQFFNFPAVVLYISHNNVSSSRVLCLAGLTKCNFCPSFFLFFMSCCADSILNELNSVLNEYSTFT